MSAPLSYLIYLGTYTRSTSKGIYAVRLDASTGALSEPTLVAEAANPTWLVLSPDRKFLYATHASQTQAIGFAVDPATAKLTRMAASPASEANSSSHLAVDATGRVLLSANYADGYVSSIPIRPDGTLGPPTHLQHTGHSVNPKRQDKPHAHSVTLSPDNRFVIVCDLGLDKIFSYALDPLAAKLTPAHPPFVATDSGSGPRHFKFGADGRHGYAINEMGGTIAAYDYDALRGALSPIQTISTLPADFTGEKWNAEIRVHPNGRFLYGSNRTHDSLAVFAVAPATGRLTLVEIVPSGGKIPRNFALSPDGLWLVCAHQDSDNLAVFRIDPSTGRLTPTVHSAKVPMCVCVLFYH
ncbi:MAG: lactonase family protein [Opitutaceae bacterium]